MRGIPHAQCEAYLYLTMAPDDGHYICCSKRTHGEKVEWWTLDDEVVSRREEARKDQRAHRVREMRCCLLQQVPMMMMSFLYQTGKNFFV